MTQTSSTVTAARAGAFMGRMTRSVSPVVDAHPLPDGTPVELIAHRPGPAGHRVDVRVLAGPHAGTVVQVGYWEVRWEGRGYRIRTIPRLQPVSG